MQLICNDQTIRSNTVKDLKECNSQSLATQAKKGEQLVSMMPDIKKNWLNGCWYRWFICKKWNFEKPNGWIWWKNVRNPKQNFWNRLMMKKSNFYYN